MIAVFDVNGTLTDPSGIGDPWGRRDIGVRVLHGAMLSSMAASLIGEFVPFVEHLRDALASECHTEQLDPASIDDALTRAGTLDPWPEAASALACLAEAGWTIAALTNSGAAGGRRTLEHAHLLDRFDHVLGVDAVGVFKPHPATYAHAIEVLDARPADVTFIAAHAWDISGASHAGMRTGWVSRVEGVLGRTAVVPDHRADDLLALAQQLTGDGRA